MSNKDFVSSVLDYLKGGDKTKVKRFHKKLVKSWNDQIKLRKDNIETYQEEIEDLNESLNEAVYSVDLDAIQTTEGTASYIETYSSNLYRIQNKISEKEEAITAAEEDIANFEALIKLVS